MSRPSKTYVALGDSMSIDDYTGVDGGGAAKQFHRNLGPDYAIVDRTMDGCTMPLVPRAERGDVLTMTIGGNDLLERLQMFLTTGNAESLGEPVLDEFATEHRELLDALRTANPEAVMIVGNIYRPAMELPQLVLDRLESINARIGDNVRAVGGKLADIHGAFSGHEDDYLTMQIEPTLAGATAIAKLFEAAVAEPEKQ